MTFPFLNSLGFDIFPLTGNIGSHTKFGLRTAGFQDILQHLVVTVRCFDEKLCLMLTVYPLFQFLQSFLTFSRFDRQITVESETLSVEARAHDRQDNRRRSHQRNHLQILALCDSYNVCSRIGNGRTTGFRDYSHRISFLQRFQITRDSFGRRMFVQRIKRQFVDIDIPIHFFQEAACRAHILYDKMTNLQNDFSIVRRKDFFYRSITKSHRQQV